MNPFPHTCQKRRWTGHLFVSCGNQAKVEVGGKWFCGVHDLARLQKLRDTKEAERKAVQAERDARNHAQAMREAEIARRAACYDDLLSALVLCRDQLGRYDGESVGWLHSVEVADKAIDSARRTAA